MSVLGWWFDESFKDDNFWISIFIPYVRDRVDHYRQLREADGRSEAVVVGHSVSESLRNEGEEEIKDVGEVAISLSGGPDDSENLTS
ncbi:hypothetical protein [Burkholderia sp. BCC1999]|uniref:hypothetical protein n=1 Tax=Burkholderia sp. BCC1999 TaxID=2817448 RepID=UPI002AC32EB5|nr:hypothetical protein [Burkholderia sp. BCC1999]